MTPTKRFSNWRQRYYPFLWFIAAADEGKLIQCPAAEQDKQAGIGLAIVFTAIMAMLSGYFALISIIPAWYIVLPVAIFWGFLILNLDRVMVGSMRKDPDGNKWKELLSATPRIALAVLISFLITKPIEVAFFRNQINTSKNSVIEKDLDKEMSKQDSAFRAMSAERNGLKMEQAALEKTASDCSKDPGWAQANDGVKSCREQYNALETSIQGLRKSVSALYINSAYSYVDEETQRRRLNAAGRNRQTGFSVQINNKRREQQQLDCAARQQAADELCNNYRAQQGIKLGKATVEADRRNEQWTNLDSLRTRMRDSLKTTMLHAYDDVFGQLRILKALKKTDTAMAQAGWLILLLFFTLETCPIIVKILTDRGQYDRLLHVADEQSRQQEGHDITMAEEHSRTQLDAARQSKDSHLAKEKEATDKMIDESLQANSALGSAIIRKWQEREMKKLDDNPDDYLNNVITANT